MPFKLLGEGIIPDESPKPDKSTFLSNKLGKDKFELYEKVIAKWSEEKGIPISFRGVMSQSTRGHRLSRKAYQLGGEKLQTPVLCALFKAHLEEGQDIADLEILSDIAAKTGMMTKEEALAFLKSDELEKEVNEMCDAARSRGITGVPMTVIDGKWAISGGQSSDVFVQIFQKLAAAGVHASPSSPFTSPVVETDLCP